MKRIVLASCGLWIAGCAGSTAQEASTADAALRASAQEEELRRLRADRVEAGQRIRDLEGQLALARAEVRDLRGELRGPPTRSVRIGREERSDVEGEAPAGGSETMQGTHHEDDGPRPLLRLYGSRDEEPLYDSPPPPLARAPMPTLPASSAPATAQPQPGPVPSSDDEGASRTDAALARYRRALALVRGRRLEEAEAAFTAFLGEHADDEYADDALYWRGEVRYALRRYEDAVRDFRQMVAAHPDGDRVPDALLKIGLCHSRMGDPSRARAYFRRVRNQFPDSLAARLASQEDAS